MTGDRAFPLKLLGFIALIFLALVAIEFAVDFHGALLVDKDGAARPVHWSDLKVTPSMVRGVASPCARAVNNLVALMLTFIALAIPITANMYTPRLVELFVKDRVNIVALASCGVLGAHSIFAASMSFDAYGGALPLYVLVASSAALWLLVIPYYFYVLRFLDPTTIIMLVSRQITEEARAVADGRRLSAEGQRSLDARIAHLGSVILRAVDRGDRDVAFAAIRALHEVVVEYGRIKPRIDRTFFRVGEEIFSGMPSAAIDLVNREEVWVERKLLQQLALAYTAALAKMPDGVGAICDALKDTAVAMDEAKAEPAVLALAVRFLNTLLREGIKKKDVHAVYDSLYHYKSLARKIMHDRPDLTVEMAGHMKSYADLAIEGGSPMIYELVSYELADVAEWAIERGHAPASAWLDRLLEMEGVNSRVRIVKSRLVLASFLAVAGKAPELARVRATLEAVPRTVLERARDGIQRARARAFREVSDRELDFDYVDDARKQKVRDLVDELLARSGSPAPARAA